MNDTGTPPDEGNAINSANWLVILPSWVGDTVMATPLLRAMRSALTDDRRLVAYLRPGLDEILDGCGIFDQVIVGRPDGLTGPWREARRIKGAGCDRALILPNSFRLALTARLAHIPSRTGYARDGRGLLLSDPVDCPMPGGWSQPISAVDYYLKLGAAIGVTTDDRRLILDWTDQQRQRAHAILDACHVEPGEPFVLLNPGANRADKRWPADRFAQLGRQLHAEFHCPVLVNGAPAERQLVEQIVGTGGEGFHALTNHGITLGALKVIGAAARLVITNDTGTRHLAAGAMNRDPAGIGSIVSLFGPTDPAWARINCPFETILTAADGFLTSIPLDRVLAACRSIW